MLVMNLKSIFCMAALVVISPVMGWSEVVVLKNQTGDEPRQIFNLDKGWRFKYGADEKAAKPKFNDAAWEKVNVPHTWNEKDGADGGNDYKRGPGWYRLKFKAPTLPKGRRAYLRFEGVTLMATVWLNGKEIGNHVGGFSAFCLDATDALNPGAANVLV